jgi:hypothetical protein
MGRTKEEMMAPVMALAMPGLDPRTIRRLCQVLSDLDLDQMVRAMNRRDDRVRLDLATRLRAMTPESAWAECKRVIKPRG